MASSTLPNTDKPTLLQKYVTRFSLSQRIEHIVMLTAFTILGVTGLPQKYAAAEFSQFVLNVLGGIEPTRVIHRAAAIVLMAISIYHLVAVLYRVIVKRSSLSMLPTFDDFLHLWHDLQYYFGRRAHKAYYGRYNYAEKAEYLAVVWGTLVMIVTGFMMWNPIATATLLPGEAIPAAKAAHGGEAVLAVLAIILWHFYHVHVKQLNKSMFTGRLSRAEMTHEHPAELAMIEQGLIKEPAATVIAKRQRVFFPIAGVATVVMLIGLFTFVTFEQSAIETVPRPSGNVQAFVPFTPTPTLPPTQTPTPAPTATPGAAPTRVAGAAVDSWESGIAQILDAKCAACHIQAQLSGLSLKTYADALKGGASGPAIVPNDVAQSALIRVQLAGNHAAQLSQSELAKIRAWIEAGAPEKSVTPAVAPGAPGAAAEGWTGGIDQLITAKCAACHVNSQLGDLSLKTYAAALEGGKSGAAIVPNDPDTSVIVQIQSKGGHAGQLTTDELNRVIAWIKAGAPETVGAVTPATTPTPEPTPIASATAEGWTGGIDQLITAKCAACHVNSQLGDLSLKTYAAALKGGKSGAAIVPNDPDTSVIVQIQSKGGHAGQLTTDELNRVIAWIKAGAPETVGAVTPTLEATVTPVEPEPTPDSDE